MAETVVPAQPAGTAPEPDHGDGQTVLRPSRRTFLRTGTLGAAAAGLATAVPGFAGLFTAASADAPAVTGAAEDTEAVAPDVAGPIIAHVTDASTGELSVFVGNQEIVTRNPQLVQQLLRAGR